MHVTSTPEARALPIGTPVIVRGHPSRTAVGLRGVVDGRSPHALGVDIRLDPDQEAPGLNRVLRHVTAFDVLSTPPQETPMPIIDNKSAAQALPMRTEVIIRDHFEAEYIGKRGTVYEHSRFSPLGIRIRDVNNLTTYSNATAIEVVNSNMVQMADIERMAEAAKRRNGSSKGITDIVNILRHDHAVMPEKGGWTVVRRVSTGQEIARFQDREQAKAFRDGLAVRTEVPFEQIVEVTRQKAGAMGWCSTWQQYVEDLRPKPAVHPNVAKYLIGRPLQAGGKATVSVGAKVKVVSSIDPVSGSLLVDVTRPMGEQLPVRFTVNGITSAVVDPVQPY